MGWAARKKFKGNEDSKFMCTKCYGTGVRGFRIDPFRRTKTPIRCRCKLDDLAKHAVEKLEERKNEDVKEWAKNLAADVADLND